MSEFYDESQRALQDEFESRPLADRLKKLIVHPGLDEQEQAFIAARNNVFLSTVDAEGFPTVSHKGGDVGFVKVLDETTLLIPCYDGNGMWLSAGNVDAQGKVGLLFIDFENPHRLRVQGRASLQRSKQALSHWPEVALAIEVSISDIWMNCPRYVHKMQAQEQSINVPRVGVETPQAEWKSIEIIKDVVPRQPHEVNRSEFDE